MTEVASAYVTLIPSAKDFGRKLSGEIDGDVKRSGDRSGRVFGTTFARTGVGPIKSMVGVVGKSMIAGFAAVAGTKFLSGAISDASDLEEAASKVNVVFGKQGDAIRKASETSASSMGLTKAAYLGATGSLGNLLVALKIAPDAAAGMSQQMVKLAGDLASFNNVKPEEALAALQSGLTGETEPLKRFGVNMNDATLKAQALKLGLIKTTKEALTPQSKALAAQALIMDQTGKAQGDFARTSGGLANQQRILAAQFGDVKARIGSALLPVITALVTFFTSHLIPAFADVQVHARALGDLFAARVLPVLQQVGGFLQDNVVPVVAGFAAVLGGSLIASIVPAIAGVAAFVGSLTSLTGIGAAASATLAALGGPVTVTIGALALLTAGVVYAYKHFAGFRQVVDQFASTLVGAFNNALAYAQRIWPQVQEAVGHVINAVKAIISGFVTVATAVWKQWGDEIMRVARAAWDHIQVVVRSAVKIVQGVIETVLAVINGDWGDAWDGIKKVVAGAWDAIKSTVKFGATAMSAVIDAAMEGIAKLWGVAWDALKRAAAKVLTEVVDFMKKLPGRIMGAVAELPEMFVTLGADMIRGLIRGIASMASSAKDAAVDAVKGAYEGAKNFLKIFSPSRLFAALGAYVGEGFIVGMTGTADQIAATGTALAEKVTAAFSKMKTGVDEQINAVIGSGKSKLTALADEITTTFDSFKSLATAVSGTGGLSGLGGGTDEASKDETSVARMISQLNRKVSTAAEFAANLLKLKAKDLNAAAIAELAQAGVEQGASSADALAHASGRQIAVLNQLQGKLTAIGIKVGSVGSAAMFDAGVETANGLIRGFAGQRKAIEAQMLVVAKAMQDAIKKALGIASPSRVFERFGWFTGAGLIRGVESQIRPAQEALTRLVRFDGTRSLRPTPDRLGNRYQVTVNAAPNIPTETTLMQTLTWVEALHPVAG